MGEITVTSKEVNENGKIGYIAKATNGFTYTLTHRNDTKEGAENVAVKLFRQGVIDGYVERHIEDELSGGQWLEFDDDDIEIRSQCSPNSFFNSYWVIPLTILIFLGAIFLTNGCLGL